MPSFQTILVAADFSRQSQEAFRVACALAEASGTRLIVLHVAEQLFANGLLGMMIPPPEGETELHKALKERLREAYAPDRPIDVEFHVHIGVAAEEILRAAGELGSDLIVLGTHGRTGPRRLLAGSVAEAVLRRTACPVLALHVPEGHSPAAGPIRVILHPTDFSDRSEAALRVARALAREHGARLLLLHVEPIEFSEGVALTAPLTRRDDSEPLMQLRAKAHGPDLKHPVETRCERGDPATGILRVSEEIGCDLIVLGSHGRGGLGRLLMGSVAEAVLRRASCPALIVKHTRDGSVEAPAEPGRRAVTVF